MAWNHGLLTDSGSFQMVSLLKLANITEEGVEFENPHDGKKMMLTPEISIGLQNSIGTDIMMQLNDIISLLTTGPHMEEAMWQSVYWLDCSIKAHKHPTKQNLFPIVQGSLDECLHRLSAKELVKHDSPGYAIGSLSRGKANVIILANAYLHTTMTKDTTRCHLITIHNIAFQMCLMCNIHHAIVMDQFPLFICEFMQTRFGKTVPLWIVEALKSVNADLTVADENSSYTAVPIDGDSQKEPSY
ncbi:hypothetical protein LPJ64_005476 [Coemansia asiatica]|uniref:tRNA-guanine(15) transglycosylase-like domain-containing protein n=1 Tax=Coemansia asiatica TaxID=1052880 RepID=A0A9W8CHM2_9FUNG|nr:hypothetical protein LPJ64_005476 [Coemansia asiatica]